MPLCVVYTCSYLASRPSRGSAAGQTRRIRRRRASDTLQTATYRRTIHVRTVFSSDGGARPIARPSVRAVAVQMQNKRGHYDCSNDDSGQHCCRCCSCCCAESNLRRNDTPRHGTALRDALLCCYRHTRCSCKNMPNAYRSWHYIMQFYGLSSIHKLYGVVFSRRAGRVLLLNR